MDDAVFLGDLDALEPVRKTLRHVLLPKSLLPDTGRITFHRDRPAAQMRNHQRGHRFVICRYVALRDAILREEYFFGMGDHGCSRVTSRGFLSKRTPMRRGCR